MNSMYNQVPTAVESQDIEVGYYRTDPTLIQPNQPSPVTEECRCRYPSKRCERPRAIKRNGEMHRFCDAHRDRANQNQRRLEARRRLEMQQNPSDSGERSPPHGFEPAQNQKLADQDEVLLSSPPLHSIMAQDELMFLSQLLSQNSLDDLTCTDDGTCNVADSLEYHASFPC